MGALDMKLKALLNYEGNWWIPGKNRKVGGRLISGSTGVFLELYRSLQQAIVEEGGVTRGHLEWMTLPVVHGTTRDGTNITVLNASGLTGPFEDFAETYDVEATIVGEHLQDDAFVEVYAHFDWLDRWLDPSSLSFDPESSTETRVRENRIELAEFSSGGDTIKLVGGTIGSYSHTLIHIERYSSLLIQLASPKNWKHILENRIRPFQDFLTLSLGITIRPTEIFARSTSDEGPLNELHFHLARDGTAESTDGFLIDTYNMPTLIKFADISQSAQEVLEKWYELWFSNKMTLVQLMAPYYAPFMYGEHQFSAIFQSAEAWHKAHYSGRERDKAEHRDRVRAVINAAEAAEVDDEIIEWATRTLRGRNDKPLAGKIEDVVKSTGSVGDRILSAAPDFGRRLTNARTSVAHPVGDSKSLDASARDWHGEVLLWVMRACLLARVGIDDVAERVLKRRGFRRALAKVEEWPSRSDVADHG